MPWDTLIRNGQVVTRDGVQALDVAIEGDAIVALAPELSGTARETIDARGLHVFPGVIDAHVHFNEPGRTDWEGWATGSAALAAGGGTCCFEMPLNAHPPTLDGVSFDLKRAAAEASSRVDFALWGGLTPANLDTLDELADRGVVGLKAFMSNSGIDDFGRADDETLRGMTVAARRGLIVGVHAESEEITSKLTAEIRARGGTSWRDYLDSRPIEAEVEAIERAIRYAREAGCRLHVVHVSSSAGVANIRSMTVPVMPHERDAHATRSLTAETCPHYLLLTDDDLLAKGAAAKCAPPVRSHSEVAKLCENLLAGRIDLVASDHSPAPASMKGGDDAFKIWGGISGVQSTLPALLTIGVPPVQAAMLTATNVAERFDIARKGEIKIGFDADLALVDLAATYTLTRTMLHDRHKLSPYVGRDFTGRVRRTIARGQTVFLDGEMVGISRGRFVRPERGAMSDALAQVVRGPLLVPRADGRVDFFPDGALAADASGTLTFVGAFAEIAAHARNLRLANGVMIPPLVDIHLHIPQHPIRGHFVDGVPDDAPGGKLLAGLQRNVFPTEAKCHDPAYAQHVVDAFARDVLSHGVIGGCAYMMVSPRATNVALATLPETWSVGMVLMNQNCPDYLTTNEPSVERDIESLAKKYGTRCVVTDRFAVAVDSRLRSRAAAIAARLGLRTQTHLNEQVGEKEFVERVLYPDARSYTHVYLDDGLLDHRCVLAHCIQMRDDEWSLVRDTGSVVAHCPTSNLLLGSGTMPLDAVIDRGIPYAIATDVGASPTVSMLAEMGRFMSVHAGTSSRATPAEALYRATRAPAEILGINCGVLEVGRPMSFVEVDVDVSKVTSADAAIRALVPGDLDSPMASVARVTLGGRVMFDRGESNA